MGLFPWANSAQIVRGRNEREEGRKSKRKERKRGMKLSAKKKGDP